MTSKPVAFRLADLGITQLHSRPHADDNPYSDAQRSDSTVTAEVGQVIHDRS
jgi:hypothetical protein